MYKNYPSHVTKEQYLYELFCAILYLLKSGCQWRMLPKNSPKWQTVYYYGFYPVM